MRFIVVSFFDHFRIMCVPQRTSKIPVMINILILVGHVLMALSIWWTPYEFLLIDTFVLATV